MKNKVKWILVFAIGLTVLLLALGGCNFLNHIPSPSVFTPTLADEVGNAVAMTLTAISPTEVPTIEIEIILPTNTAISVITNTPPSTPTPQPTDGPTETPEPTATEEPTVTPTGYPQTMTGDPRPEFILIYFDQINRKDYEAAWNNLTLEFRKNKHYNWLPNFEEGYEDMDLCEVEVNDISVITSTSTYAKMFAEFIYKTGADCTPYPYYFEAHFNYDVYQGRWLLDGLTETD